MKIIVLFKMVPDVVEELVVDGTGCRLDAGETRFTLNESDDHALEQALLIKERRGAEVIVVGCDGPESDDAFFTALAKGADRAVKAGGMDPPGSTREMARVLAAAVKQEASLWPADLVLTGTQANDDLDGLLAPVFARLIELPTLSIVTSVETTDAAVSVVKEFAGGLRARFELPLPCVLGIQAAERPPRYVPVAKVRAVMRSARIEAAGAPRGEDWEANVETVALAPPPEGAGATIIPGDPEEASQELCLILAGRGLL
jgi:electron transfer flavoprotein beta subunit